MLLSLNGSEVEARGFRSFFAMANAGFAFKKVFEPGGVFSVERVSRVVPRWLLFTAISEEEKTRITELGQADAMIRLIRACPWATYDTTVAGDNLGLLSRLARQVKAFDLVAGTDLLAPGHAVDFLNEHLVG